MKCPNCRSVHIEEPAEGSSFWFCSDCGFLWDGSMSEWLQRQLDPFAGSWHCKAPFRPMQLAKAYWLMPEFRAWAQYV